MTACLYYTIANIRGDKPPVLLSVHREKRGRLEGYVSLIVPANPLRRDCMGKFTTWEEGDRALFMARAVFEKHERAIKRAEAALAKANGARFGELRQRLKTLSNLSAAH